MLNSIIAIYAITDDLLKAIGHNEDSRRVVSDAEIITTALCAAMFFNNNHSKACTHNKEHGFMPNMLDKSRFTRFNRILHGIFIPSAITSNFPKSIHIVTLCKRGYLRDAM